MVVMVFCCNTLQILCSLYYSIFIIHGVIKRGICANSFTKKRSLTVACDLLVVKRGLTFREFPVALEVERKELLYRYVTILMLQISRRSEQRAASEAEGGLATTVHNYVPC